VTVVSTLTVTSTSITTSDAQTVASAPTTGNYGPTGTDSSGGASTSTSSSGGGGGGGSPGLSTGAKAGIGAAFGALGLIALVAALWWWIKRRNTVKDDSLGDVDAGMSEVPVGGPVVGAGASPGLAAATGAAAGGAAAGIGRLSPARPGTTEMDTTASAWKPPPSSTAELGDTGPTRAELGSGEPRPHDAAEMDSTPRMGYNSGPVHDVYEMPAQNYR
jgi:hypothetical protein